MNKLDTMILALVEKCENGEITEEQKDLLIEKAMEKYSDETEDTEQEVSESETPDNTDINSKLEAMILALVEKCENGEITEEQKDLLIEKAMEKYSDETTEAEPTEDVATESGSDDITDAESSEFVLGVLESVENGDLTVEEAHELLESDLYQEKGGSTPNTKIKEKFKKSRAEYKASVTKAKSYIKSKNYKSAVVVLTKTKVELEAMKKCIQNIKNDGSEVTLKIISDIAKDTLLMSLVSEIFIDDVDKIAKNTRTEFINSLQRTGVQTIAGKIVNKPGANLTEICNKVKTQALVRINAEIARCNRLINKCKKKMDKK